MILRKDKDNIEWIYLKLYNKWEEPKPIGADRYNRPRKELRFSIDAYIIRKRDKKKLLEYLSKKALPSRVMPDDHSYTSGIFNRENYWSPVSKWHNQYRTIWEEVKGLAQTAMQTTRDAVGEMSKDKSGAHSRYDMPSKPLFEGMGLEYAPDDGSFRNGNGEVIVLNVEPEGVLVRRQDLFEFLEKMNYEIIWTLYGEKNAYSEALLHGNEHYRAIGGVYHYDGSGIIGKLAISKRG